MTFSVGSFIWLAAGVLMILAEFVIPGFVICFFGISALLVGVLCALLPLQAVWQLIIFAAAGVGLLLLCRKFMPGIFKGNSKVSMMDIDGDDVVGAKAVVLSQISPDMPGKVEFRGSCWEAAADEELLPGMRVIIVGRDNLELKVASIKNKGK